MSPHVGNSLEELDRLGLAQGFEVAVLVAHAGRAGIVPQGAADLLRELVVQAVDQVADVIAAHCPGAVLRGGGSRGRGSSLRSSQEEMITS